VKAVDGKDGIDVRRKDRVDVVITDNHMPKVEATE